MNEVKVWCDKCSGLGTFDYGVGCVVSKCTACDGKGYTIHSFGELAHDYKITIDPPHDAHFSINERDQYTITDAQADAAVLDTLSRAFPNKVSIVDQTNDIVLAIYARLHAFYCGAK